MLSCKLSKGPVQMRCDTLPPRSWCIYSPLPLQHLVIALGAELIKDVGCTYLLLDVDASFDL